MTKPFSFFVCALFCILSLTFAAEKPNIVWIVSEDLSPLVGPYAENQVQTPHIDRLAAEGVSFDNAFAPAPVCAPSRFAIITGRHASAHPGAEGMRGWADLPEPIVFFPQFLREQGYYTANWGKVDYNTGRYLGGDTDLALKAAWNESAHIWEHPGDDAPERGPHWRHRKDPEQPFFQMFNLISTHMSQLFPQERSTKDPLHDPAAVILPPHHPDTPTVRRDWAFFLDRIEEADREVGGILDDLIEDGELDDTIVFWFSDHGGALMRSKRSIFDSGTRVPMVIWFGKNVRHLAPEAKEGRIERLVSLVDLAPSMLNLLGLPIPDYMHGQPFLGKNLPAPAESIFLHRQRMSEHIDLSRAVHDGRFLYIRHYLPRRPLGPPGAFQSRIPAVAEWAGHYGKSDLPAHQRAGLEAKPFEELYDTRTDIHNLANVAENPAYAATLHRLRQALDTRMVNTEDAGLFWTFDPSSTTFETVKSAADLAAKADSSQLPALRDLLRSEIPVLRFWGASGSAELGTAAADLAEDLRPLLHDPEPVVRILAAEALAAQGHWQETYPVFKEALSTSGRPQPSTALWSLNSMLILGPSHFTSLKADIEKLSSGRSFENHAANHVLNFMKDARKPKPSFSIIPLEN